MGFAIHVFLDLHNVPDWAISFLTGQNTTRHACASLPWLSHGFLESGTRGGLFPFVGRRGVPAYVPAEPGFEETVVLDGHWWAKTGIGKAGESCSSLFSCESDFFTEVVFAFRFVPSFPAVCGRSKIKKHVSVCPWCWEPVLASLLGILFQRQRPQQWLRNTRVSFASGQL